MPGLAHCKRGGGGGGVLFWCCGEERGTERSLKQLSYPPTEPQSSEISQVKRAGRSGGLKVKVIFLLLRIKRMG